MQIHGAIALVFIVLPPSVPPLACAPVIGRRWWQWDLQRRERLAGRIHHGTLRDGCTCILDTNSSRHCDPPCYLGILIVCAIAAAWHAAAASDR
jgi:hypothetical protein